MNLHDHITASGRKRLEHALLLIARQHGGSAETASAARADFAEWRALEPANESAAQAALMGWSTTDAQGLKGDVPMPSTQAERDRVARRRVLSVLGVGGVAAMAGMLGRWHWQQPLERVALHTEHGQMLSQSLPDGTHLDLAPATEAVAIMYRDRREVHLARGEIRLDVVHDADRPLEVLTPLGRVRVLGTVFSVALRESGLHVSVAQGRVAVWAADNKNRAQTANVMVGEGADVVLSAGDAARIDADGTLDTHRVNAQDVGAWRDGWLVFDQTPLPDVVSRWNDYLAHPLVLDSSSELQSLRLTGSFKLRDPATFIASLPRSLPVRIERLADGRMAILRR